MDCSNSAASSDGDRAAGPHEHISSATSSGSSSSLSVVDSVYNSDRNMFDLTVVIDGRQYSISRTPDQLSELTRELRGRRPSAGGAGAPLATKVNRLSARLLRRTPPDVSTEASAASRAAAAVDATLEHIGPASPLSSAPPPLRPRHQRRTVAIGLAPRCQSMLSTEELCTFFFVRCLECVHEL